MKVEALRRYRHVIIKNTPVAKGPQHFEIDDKKRRASATHTLYKK